MEATDDLVSTRACVEDNRQSSDPTSPKATQMTSVDRLSTASKGILKRRRDSTSEGNESESESSRKQEKIEEEEDSEKNEVGQGLSVGGRDQEELSNASSASTQKRKLNFRDVTVYYFKRAQGFTCVPSQGGSTLGMSNKHTRVETFTLAGYAREKHRMHMLKLREHRRRILAIRHSFQLQQMQQQQEVQQFHQQSRQVEKASEDAAGSSNAPKAVAREALDDLSQEEDEDDGDVEIEEDEEEEESEDDEIEEEEEDDSETDEEVDEEGVEDDLPPLDWPFDITPTNEDGEEEDEATVLDNALSDNYFFLQPVPSKRRRALLRASGVEEIDISEKEDCRMIRNSREVCGCNCLKVCVPDSCLCAKAGITCQVDRMNFPCGCDRIGCGNPNGRVEFNPSRVRSHLLKTLMRLEAENASASADNSNNGGFESPAIHDQPQASSVAIPHLEADGTAAPTWQQQGPEHQPFPSFVVVESGNAFSAETSAPPDNVHGHVQRHDYMHMAHGQYYGAIPSGANGLEENHYCRDNHSQPINVQDFNINGLIQVNFRDSDRDADVDSTSSTLSCIDEDVHLHIGSEARVTVSVSSAINDGSSGNGEDNPSSPDSLGELIKKSIVETVSA